MHVCPIKLLPKMNKTNLVLDLHAEPVDRGKVARHYRKWREAKGLPVRCDNSTCMFHTQPLVWNGKPFKPILDHFSGNALDNRPENLRYLCPNCDSQNTETRGGANARRISRFDDGSYIARRTGGRSDAVLKARSLEPTTRFGTPTVLRHETQTTHDTDR